MMFNSIVIIIILMTQQSHSGPQGLLPGCPPCNCPLTTGPSGPNSNNIINSVIENLPDNLRTPKEAFGFIRSKITDRNVYKYVAMETLQHFDKVIDDSIEVSNRFSVLAELVASHLVDAIIPGGSAIFEGVKFLLSMFRTTKENRIVYAKMLDPAHQATLIDAIADMLAKYEEEEPGCLKDSKLQGPDGRGVTINNFLYHEGVCPVNFTSPLDDPVEIVDIRIRVPVDFTRIAHKTILLRGPYAITFNDQYSLMIDGMYMRNREAIERLVFLYHHALRTTEVQVHNVVAIMNVDDMSMLSGNDYSQCLQRSLFYQKGIYDVKAFYGSYIPYKPLSFSRSQVAVKRLTCHPPPPSNGCVQLKCSSLKEYFEHISSINTISPADFNSEYPGHLRLRRNEI